MASSTSYIHLIETDADPKGSAHQLDSTISVTLNLGGTTLIIFPDTKELELLDAFNQARDDLHVLIANKEE
jgi:hypothetical protein